jgi:hypothetical protein
LATVEFGDQQWTERYSGATMPMAKDAVLEPQPTATAMIVGELRFTAGAFADVDGAAYAARLARAPERAITTAPVVVDGVKRARAGTINTPIGPLPYVVVHRPSGPGGVIIVGRGGDPAVLTSALAVMAKGLRFNTAKPPTISRELRLGDAVAGLIVDERYARNETVGPMQWSSTRWDAPVSIAADWIKADGVSHVEAAGMTTNLLQPWKKRSGVLTATQQVGPANDAVAIRQRGDYALIVVVNGNPTSSPIALEELAFAIANKATLVVPTKPGKPKLGAPKPPPAGGFLPEF